jgi:hypothetical protein
MKKKSVFTLICGLSTVVWTTVFYILLIRPEDRHPVLNVCGAICIAFILGGASQIILWSARNISKRRYEWNARFAYWIMQQPVVAVLFVVIPLLYAALFGVILFIETAYFLISEICNDVSEWFSDKWFNLRY